MNRAPGTATRKRTMCRKKTRGLLKSRLRSLPFRPYELLCLVRSGCRTLSNTTSRAFNETGIPYVGGIGYRCEERARATLTLQRSTTMPRRKEPRILLAVLDQLLAGADPKTV